MLPQYPLTIYDIFCDASVGPELYGACAGFLVENRSVPIARQMFKLIQPNGTNNSGEVAAVAGAVNFAANWTHQMSQYNAPTHFNIFSDSLITIRGIREWMLTWCKNANGNCLKNAAGKDVSNQEYYKYIYWLVTSFPVSLSFYHQPGHVTKDFEIVEPEFIKQNGGTTLEQVGLTPAHICMSNDEVDRETRRTINDFLVTDPHDRQVYEKNIIDTALMRWDIDRSVTTMARYSNIVNSKLLYQVAS